MKSTRSFSPLYARRYSSLIALLLVLVFSIQLAAGQAQEGNQDIGSIDGSGKDVDSGYLSYVSDMDSAASVREAMETLSWASKGSSWLMETQEAATSEEVSTLTASIVLLFSSTLYTDVLLPLLLSSLSLSRPFTGPGPSHPF